MCPSSPRSIPHGGRIEQLCQTSSVPLVASILTQHQQQDDDSSHSLLTQRIHTNFEILAFDHWINDTYLATPGITTTLHETPLVNSAYHHLTSKHINECMQLLENNMAALYRSSSWGWNSNDKRHELQDTRARFLLVYSQRHASPLAAFVHYRWEWESGNDDNDNNDEESVDNVTRAVLYLYELQVAAPHRRQGLGSFLMQQCVEPLARLSGMDAVMLTVFHCINPKAFSFYRALGYEIDASSPSQWIEEDEDETEEADYEILSKPM
jgi:ribosomal protein S18 acetylase RimI-like enzyme